MSGALPPESIGNRLLIPLEAIVQLGSRLTQSPLTGFQGPVWRVLCFGLAYLCTFLGSVLLPNTGQRGVALAALVTGAAIYVTVLRNERSTLPPILLHTTYIGRRVAIAAVGGTTVCVAANILQLLQPMPGLGLAGALWLISMGLLAVGASELSFRWPTRDRPIGTRDWPRENQARFPAARVRAALPEPWARSDVLMLAGLLGAALFARTWTLAEVPSAIHPDEFITGRVAIGSFLTGTPVSLFQTVWDGINLPALWFLLVAKSLEFGGITLTAVRMPAAVFGAVAVVPFYALIREVWGRNVAIATTSFLAFGTADVALSRVTENNITTAFFWAAVFFFLLRGTRTGQPVWWGMAGLAGGLSEHFYYGTRLLPLVLLSFGLYLLLVHRDKTRIVGQLALVGAGYVVGFGPLLVHFITHPSLYMGRGLGVLTLSPFGEGGFSSLADVFSTAMAQNLLTISTLAAIDPLYAGTLLLPGEAALLVLGAALLCAKLRHPAAFLILVSGLGVMFVGGVLIPPGGAIRHWTPAFPSYYAALAPALGGVIGPLASTSRRWMAPAATLLIVCAVGTTNLNEYFFHYHMPPDFEARAAEMRYFAGLGDRYRVATLGNSFLPFDPEGQRYLAASQEGQHLANPALDLPLPGKEGSGLGFALFPNEAVYRNVLETMYPGGVWGSVASGPERVHLFETYTVDPVHALAPYGTTVELLDAQGALIAAAHVNTVGELPPDASGASRARWSGLIFTPKEGEYRFDPQRGADQKLLIDRKSVLPLQPLNLRRGWVPFELEEALPAPTAVALRRSLAGDPWEQVLREHLWPESMSGQFSIVTPSVSSTMRIVPFVGFTDLGALFEESRGKQSAVWSGYIDLDVSGAYGFALRTDGTAMLAVDDHVLASVCPGESTAETRALLGTGRHRIGLLYESEHPRLLELLWMPTGEPWRVLEALALGDPQSSGPEEPKLALQCPNSGG